jgi:hypothetical protein
MSEALEQRLARLEGELEELRTRIGVTEDIEAIKKLQHSYGYYFERGMNREVADLFSEAENAAIHFRGIGGFLGANAKKSWDKHLPGMDGPTYLHLLALTSGIIDVAPDGKTAKGRWYGWGLVAHPADVATPDAINHFGFGAVYENRYVKEGGVWKIQVLDLALLVKFKNPGYVDPERYDIVYVDPTADAQSRDEFAKMFDFRDQTPTIYPSAFTLPFHFRHPVTGKQTSDVARNAAAGFTETAPIPES